MRLTFSMEIEVKFRGFLLSPPRLILKCQDILIRELYSTDTMYII